MTLVELAVAAVDAWRDLVKERDTLDRLTVIPGERPPEHIANQQDIVADRASRYVNAQAELMAYAASTS
jgi:hypothetical protein